jgi:hypothetical protein
VGSVLVLVKPASMLLDRDAQWRMLDYLRPVQNLILDPIRELCSSFLYLFLFFHCACNVGCNLLFLLCRAALADAVVLYDLLHLIILLLLRLAACPP